MEKYANLLQQAFVIVAGFDISLCLPATKWLVHQKTDSSKSLESLWLTVSTR